MTTFVVIGQGQHFETRAEAEHEVECCAAPEYCEIRWLNLVGRYIVIGPRRTRYTDIRDAIRYLMEGSRWKHSMIARLEEAA